MIRSALLSGVIALGAVAASAAPRTVANDPWCREASRDDRRAMWCEVREATDPAAAEVLAVDASPNGGVKATGWDRPEVRWRAQVVAIAETEAEAREMVAQVRIVTGSTLRAEGPASHGEAYWWVSFDLRVPHRSDLKLTSVNGPLAVADVEGRVDLDTKNGPLSLSRAGGSVHGRTANGPLTVELVGSAWVGEGLDMATVNGPVTLTVPDGYNARLETGTTNGPVHLGFPLLVQGNLKQNITATLGDGGASVRVKTTNGPLNVRRP